jgi:tungstate transport system substrate-binding protein
MRLTKIARGRAAFASRGDNSGTHAREGDLWRLTGLEPAEPWYTVAQAGMLPTLQLASERGAYTLTDIATYLVNQDRLQLKILVRGDARLENRYAVIAVNPGQAERCQLRGRHGLHRLRHLGRHTGGHRRLRPQRVRCVALRTLARGGGAE